MFELQYNANAPVLTPCNYQAGFTQGNVVPDQDPLIQHVCLNVKCASHPQINLQDVNEGGELCDAAIAGNGVVSCKV